jgi:hypothetical protein
MEPKLHYISALNPNVLLHNIFQLLPIYKIGYTLFLKVLFNSTANC